MTEENVSASTTVNAPADTVFAVLADPATHQAIDGTGWVRESLRRQAADRSRPDLPDGHVPRQPPGRATTRWPTGSRCSTRRAPSRGSRAKAPTSAATGAGDAELEFGGWIWRYDLEPVGDDRTEVTLTYDWSGVPPDMREDIQFPPFDASHLDNSLKHLAELAEAR